MNARVDGIENLDQAQLEIEIARGGRFVFYEYCISLIIFTLRRPTAIYFLRANEHGWLRGLPYAVLSGLLGWWGLPWGVIYTPLVIATDLAGGCDVTEETCRALGLSSGVQS